MGPVSIVIFDPSADAKPGLRSGLEGMEIDALILQRAPKPLDKNIVKPASASVHGQADAGVTQELCEPRTSELTALIGIEDVRPAVFRHRLFQGLDTEFDIHCIAEPPGQHLAAEPVHDSDEVQEAAAHGDVRNVSAPDLIGPVYDQAAQQIGIGTMLRMSHRRFGLLVYRLQTHPSHQAPDTFAPDFIALALEVTRHLATAVERGLHELLVNEPHQCEVQNALALPAAVETRPADRDQLALAFH